VSPAILSLIALLVAIALSMASKLNVGVLAMAFAWLIGTYVADWRVEQVAAGFPSSLFLTLTGVTLLFALAESNGTLERIAHRAVGLARGRTRLIPILLFAIAFILSSVGPGAITTVALLIPIAMAVGTRAGVPTVAAPVYKQVFSLVSGECLAAADKSPKDGLPPDLATYPVEVRDGVVHVGLP